MKRFKCITYALISIFLMADACNKEPHNDLPSNFQLKSCLCNKNPSSVNSEVDLCFMLVNNKDQVCDSFRTGEILNFKFYLINNTDNEVKYQVPCYELTDLVHIYMKDSLNKYTFIGAPEIRCVLWPYFDILKPHTTLDLGFLSTKDVDINWPVLNPGSYYSGDSLRLGINNKKYTFYKRIYFKIY